MRDTTQAVATGSTPGDAVMTIAVADMRNERPDRLTESLGTRGFIWRDSASCS
jgi:hypothetical protein